jgi:hypothetical protein
MYLKGITICMLALISATACSKSTPTSSGTPGTPEPGGGPGAITSTIMLFAGSETERGNVDNTDPLAARFDHPTALVLDGNTLWVADGYNESALRKIDVASGKVSTAIPWNSFDGYGGRRTIRNMKLNPVTHNLLMVTKEGELWQYDPTSGDRIEIVNGVDEHGVPKDEYAAVQVGSLANTSVAEANGLAVSSDGQAVFLSDNVRGVIKKIDLNTKTSSVYAGKPYAAAHDVSEYAFADGARQSATFSDVEDLAISNNQLLVADYGWSAIRSVDGTGVTSLTGHNPGVSSIGSNKDGAISNAVLNRPAHLSPSAVGIYFCDFGGVRLLRVGQDVTTLHPDYSNVHRSGANTVAVEAAADGKTVYESQGNVINKYTVKL